MADENKGGLNNLLGGKQNPDAKIEAPVTEVSKPEPSNESKESLNSKPEGEVSDKEANALQGNAGPNLTPAYGKKPFGDENEPIVDERELDSLKQGSSAASGPKEGSDVAKALASAGVESVDDRVTYVSSIARLKIGPYQFEQGRLTLKPDAASKFDKLIETAHPRTQQSVSKVDAEAGENYARRFREERETSLQRGVDTSDSNSKSPEPSKS